MSSKPPSLKTYQYHFRNKGRCATTSLILQQEQHQQGLTLAQDMKSANPRYQIQVQNNDSISIDLSKEGKCSTPTQRYSQQLGKYTYSLLSKEIKGRKNDDVENNKISQLTYKNNNLHYRKKGQNQEINNIFYGVQDINKKVGLETDSNLNEKAKENTSQEHIDAANQYLKQIKQAEMLKNQNKQIRNLLDLLNMQITEKDKKIQNLQKQIEKQQKELTQQTQLLIQLQQQIQKPKNSKLNLSINSSVSAFQYDQPLLNIQNIQVQQTESQMIKNYEDEYLQILTLFGLQHNDYNFHEKLVKQIDKLKMLGNELTGKLQRIKQIQKQQSKAQHHSKKIQIQNVRLNVLTQFLNAQLLKHTTMIHQCNQEIQRLHLLHLNCKFKPEQ